MNQDIRTTDSPVGVVGLGLMGSSIVVSLLLAGHPVCAIAPIRKDMQSASNRIRNHLLHCERSGLLTESIIEYMHRLTITEDYAHLGSCQLVLECVIEEIRTKSLVYQKIEHFVDRETVIASNTSSIPITELQDLMTHSDRFLGIHWAEPSYMTRFMEITCGAKTAAKYAEWVFKLSHHWDKEPTLLKKDLRGFVTNRLMYAVYREGLHLMENGEASLEDVDKIFRYDAGSWMMLMGIFRRIDFLGLENYAEILKRTFPCLSNEKKVPALMQKMIDEEAGGTQNAKGFYQYSFEDAKRWDEAFALFNEEIFRLGALYPAKHRITHK